MKRGRDFPKEVLLNQKEKQTKYWVPAGYIAILKLSEGPELCLSSFLCLHSQSIFWGHWVQDPFLIFDDSYGLSIGFSIQPAQVILPERWVLDSCHSMRGDSWSIIHQVSSNELSSPHPLPSFHNMGISIIIIMITSLIVHAIQ